MEPSAPADQLSSLETGVKEGFMQTAEWALNHSDITECVLTFHHTCVWLNFDVGCLRSASLGGLARATVTGLPAETVGPTESSTAAEELPAHSSPHQDFAKEVSFV